MGIIDCHTHICDPSHFDENFAADLRRAWGELAWTGVTPEDHWEAMKELDGAIVLAFDAPACGFVVPDEYVASYVAQHPDKLIGFASVDPGRPDARARLDHAVNDLGLRGLKLGPIYQGFDPTSIDALRLFHQAETLGLPVLIHQATTFIRFGALEWARPILLDAVARACPDLVICAAHLGHPWCEELMVVVRKHPNMYMDVSALHTRPLQLYFALRSAVEYRVTHRILFGTDYPFSTVEDTVSALRRVDDVVRGTGLPPVGEAVVEGIIERDALAVLGLRG
jgi:predicted TIM-barrel fold metal-dependent hydrolase